MALYDALGDVTCTAFLSGDGTQAAATQTIYGLTPFNWTINWTINCDGNLNATTQVRDPAARMLVVKQLATAPGATCTTPASTYDTAYRYDALGRLIFVTDAKGNQTTITYDLAGRKISMQDPDMGHWTYAYDAAGKLTRQTDARGITTTLTYDALGRLLGKSYSDSTPAVQYTYDAYPAGSPCAAGPTAIGHQVQMSDGAGVRQSCFDLRGKEVLTRRTLNADAYSSAATYDIARTYDDAGELLQLTYPDGEVVKYSYTAGAISGLTSATYGSPIIAGAALTPAGAPAALGLGNGATTTYTYDFRQRVSGIATGTTTVADQSLTLTYDAAGNVATQADTRPSGSEQITYTSDQLNRLGGSATTPAMTINGAAAAFYVYDAIGNMTAKTESLPGMANDTNITLTYPASGPGAVQPHAVSAIAGTIGGAPQARTFLYDANGNMTGVPGGGSQDASFSTYDAANRLAAADTGAPAAGGTAWACMDFNYDGTVGILDLGAISASYGKTAGSLGFDPRADLNWDGVVNIFDLSRENSSYGKPCASRRTRSIRDGDGALLKREQIASGVAETSTVYIGGVYEAHSDGSVTKYYQAYGRAVAVRQVPATGGPGTLSFLLADQLGTTTMVLDATGAVVADQRYWPYGATRAGAVAQTDKLYTGQRQEQGDPAAFGLYDYHARFYSTTVGRFVSADPTFPRGSSMPLNRFAYANDNPLRFLDPSGYEPTQQDLNNCAANIIACYEWSYGGDSPNGIVFVMGLSESRTSPGDLNHYEGYAETFLDRYDPGCAGRGADCWAAAKLLETKYGSDAAYKVFGLKFIESDPHGHVWEGLLGIAHDLGASKIPWLGKHLPDRGYGELGKILRYPGLKFIVGVIGVSLGAGTAGKYFSEHPDVNIPFVMDSGANLDPGVFEGNAAHYFGLPNLVATTGFFSCGCGPIGHGVNDALAAGFYNDFDWYNLLYR